MKSINTKYLNQLMKVIPATIATASAFRNVESALYETEAKCDKLEGGLRWIQEESLDDIGDADSLSKALAKIHKIATDALV